MRTSARHRVAKQLLRHGHLYREGKKAWTKQHQAWVRRQALADPLAQRALCHMLCHLDAVDAQLQVLDHELELVATSEPWSDPVRWICSFRGVGLVTALGLLAEIDDFARFVHPRSTEWLWTSGQPARHWTGSASSRVSSQEPVVYLPSHDPEAGMGLDARETVTV